MLKITHDLHHRGKKGGMDIAALTRISICWRSTTDPNRK
jgi:hypothetical protein